MFNIDIEEIINDLDTYNIGITNRGILEDIKRCKNQQQLDSILDDLYLDKWKNSDNDYKLVSEINGICTYCIGNGLVGYIVEGVKFTTLPLAYAYNKQLKLKKEGKENE